MGKPKKPTDRINELQGDIAQCERLIRNAEKLIEYWMRKQQDAREEIALLQTQLNAEQSEGMK